MSNFKYTQNIGGLDVEAIQFTPEDQDLTRAWPRWFVDLLIDQRIMRQGFNGPWYLDKTTRLHDGDWIIWGGHANLEVWVTPNSLFTQRYRPADK